MAAFRSMDSPANREARSRREAREVLRADRLGISTWESCRAMDTGLVGVFGLIFPVGAPPAVAALSEQPGSLPQMVRPMGARPFCLSSGGRVELVLTDRQTVRAE